MRLPRPQASSRTPPPGVGDHLRGRPAGRPAERADVGARAGQGGVHRRLGAAGLRTGRDDQSFVTPAGCPSSPTPRRCSTCSAGPASGRGRPVLVPNERGLDRALAAGVGAVAVFGSATETFARKNLNRTVAESVEMFAPVVSAAGRSGLGCGPTSRCASATRGRGRCRSTRSSTSASELMDLGCDQLSLGDTIGVGHVGHVHRPARRPSDAAGIGRRPGRRALPRHLRAGAGQHAWPPCATGYRVDASTGGLGGCPYAKTRPATWPPRTSCGRSRGPACTPASTSTRWWRRACGWRGSSAARRRRAWCGRCPAADAGLVGPGYVARPPRWASCEFDVSSPAARRHRPRGGGS